MYHLGKMANKKEKLIDAAWIASPSVVFLQGDIT